MKAVVQRVLSASVTVNGAECGAIGPGLMILLGVEEKDVPSDAALMAEKVAHLRIFCDENDKMNRSLLDVAGGALVVSNFTLCADTHHGRRPSFIQAKQPDLANEYYERFKQCLAGLGVSPVASGIFGADMQVELVNDGPVTIILNTDDWKRKP